MRVLALALAAVLLAGCERDDALTEAQRRWEPTNPPAELRAAAKKAVGDGATFLTTAPTEQSLAAGVICGVVYPKDGESRVFVYQTAAKVLRLSPQLEGQNDPSAAAELLAFNQYQAPCHSA